MIEFFRAGGIAMWFILALGLVTCVSGVLYAKAKTRATLVRLALFSVATLFAAVAGVTAGFATVFMQVPAREEWARNPEMPLIVMMGIGESLTTLVLGSALLMIAWTIAAAGHFEFGGRSTGPEPVPARNH
jgi:hypothetical protein